MPPRWDPARTDGRARRSPRPWWRTPADPDSRSPGAPRRRSARPSGVPRPGCGATTSATPNAATGCGPGKGEGETAPGPALTAGQVAQQLGISESTLRTWHRRYGLDPPDAEPGHYRRYRAEDVARLRRMLELVKGGMLASEAARTVQHGESAA